MEFTTSCEDEKVTDSHIMWRWKSLPKKSSTILEPMKPSTAATACCKNIRTQKIPNQLLFTPAPTQLASISVAMSTPELEASKNWSLVIEEKSEVLSRLLQTIKGVL